MKIQFLLAFLVVTLASAQKTTLKRETLVGCWTMILEEEPSSDYLNFQKCTDLSDSKVKVTLLTFDLKHDGKLSFFQETSSPICPGFGNAKFEGTWSFHEDTAVLTLHYTKGHHGVQIIDGQLGENNKAVAFQCTIETLLPDLFTTPLESIVLDEN